MKLSYENKLEIYELKKRGFVIKRQFEGSKPYEKCYTDVTEFALLEGKLYLSPVMDGYNSEIIEFTLSRSPDLKQVQTMLEKAFPDESYSGTILHSDQVWRFGNTNITLIIAFGKPKAFARLCLAKAIVQITG